MSPLSLKNAFYCISVPAPGQTSAGPPISSGPHTVQPQSGQTAGGWQPPGVTGQTLSNAGAAGQQITQSCLRFTIYGVALAVAESFADCLLGKKD